MQSIEPHIRHIIGIDEAGRGPVAGPVAVGVVALPLERSEADSFRDSKRLASHKRELAYESLLQHVETGMMECSVAMTGPSRIDRMGINAAVADAMQRALARLSIDPKTCLVLLDGGLRAPRKYPNQQTIIKGDEKVYAIALASIAAKVLRDEKMRRLAFLYPEYGFEGHKGYGTHEHYRRIRQHGLSAWHRRSFLKALVEREEKVVGY